MNSSIEYKIDFSNANQHLFNVELTIPPHEQQVLTLTLPSWLPGSYMVRDFAKNIVTIKTDGAASIRPTDKQTWQLATAGKSCKVSYQVYALDHSVRTAFLDRQRAFFNGTSVFISVVEMTDHRHELEITKPSFDNGWRVATGLPRAPATDKYQFGRYIADDYQHLIDCPFEISDFDHIEFDVAGVCHHLILSGKHYADLERVSLDLSKLCQHHIELFERDNDTVAPFNEYWFLTNILPSGFGGLEHKNSTALLCSTFDFANKNKPTQLTDNYKTFLSLASHEYFHAWNVCRIKPEEFVPYQLAQESYTEQLWAYEGITSYYDDFSLYRAGLISFDEYLVLLSKTISRVNRGQGQQKQSVIESSFYTWTKFYQQGEDALNNIVSYYTKGSLIALTLDLIIRTNSQYSLDDVMRRLWRDFGAKNIGTKLDDIFAIASELTGYDLGPQMTQLLNDKKEVPLNLLFAAVGVQAQPFASRVDKPLSFEKDNHQPYLGMTTKAASIGVSVVNVSENSPAELAGISAHDLIIAFDKLVVSSANFADILTNIELAQSYCIDLIRQGQLLSVDIAAAESPQELTKLEVIDPHLVKRWQRRD